MQKSFFALSVLMLSGQVLADSKTNTKKTAMPYYRVRPQGTNIVRETAGWESLTNRCCDENTNNAFAVVLEYSQSFRSEDICECLFGQEFDCKDDCGCNIVVAGSCVEGRDDNGFLADNFGLAPDFKSTLNFRPRIRNFVADLEFYRGLDCWAEGLYFRANLPIVNTRWDLRVCETSDQEDSLPHSAGYYSPEVVENKDLNQTALSFFNGTGAPDLGDTVTFQKLKCSKFAAKCDSDTKTALADLELILGYNFVCDQDRTVGISLRTSAPTGNSPKGEYLFEPIAGNGGHWELGAGFNARAALWSGCNDDSSFTFYFDANITHLFDTCQTRCFDLCKAGANSRYMLAQRLKKQDADVITNQTGLNGGPATDSLTASNYVFADEFAPVANLTESKVDVGISVQGDVQLKFVYANECGVNWGFGYNFWGSACEDICLKKNCNNVDITEWALKGDAFVYGFENTANVLDNPHALAATQSGATIAKGLNRTSASCADDTDTSTNPSVDNKQFARFNNVHLEDGLEQPINTSIQPVNLTQEDINYTRTRGISHKIFTHANYSWTECENYTPFLGLGASAEFSPSASCASSCDDACETSCDTSSCSDDTNGNSVRCALNQWSVWVKGGVSFN